MSAAAQVIAFPERRAEGGGAWEPWVSEDAIARHFGVSTRTVRRWRADGLASMLVGAQRRYRIGEAERWHRQRQEDSP